MEQFNQQTPQQFPQQQPPQSFPPQPPPPQTFQQVNLHKNKSTALLIAAITIIALFLHWTTVHVTGADEQGKAIATDVGMNGFRGLGWLALAGVAGVFFASLNGNRLQDYDKNSKNIVMASFGAMVGAAIAWYININSNAAKELIAQAKAKNFEMTFSPEIGMWMAGIAGLIGLAWVSGIIKNLQQANMQSPPVYNQQTQQPFQQQPPQQYYQQPPQQFQQQPPQNPQSNQNSYPPPPPYNQNIPPYNSPNQNLNK